MDPDPNVSSSEKLLTPLSSLVDSTQHKEWMKIKDGLYQILDTKLRGTEECNFMDQVISACNISGKNGSDAFAILAKFDLKTLRAWTPEKWEKYFPGVEDRLKPLLLGVKVFKVQIPAVSSHEALQRDHHADETCDTIMFYLDSLSDSDSHYLGGIYINTGVESLEIFAAYLFANTQEFGGNPIPHVIISLGQMYGSGKTSLAKNWLNIVRLIYGYVEEHDFYNLVRFAHLNNSANEMNHALKYCLNERRGMTRPNGFLQDEFIEQSHIEKMRKMLCGELVFFSVRQSDSSKDIHKFIKDYCVHNKPKGTYTFFSVDEFQTLSDISDFKTLDSFRTLDEFRLNWIKDFPSEDLVEILIAGRGLSAATTLSTNASAPATLKSVQIHPLSLQHIELILKQDMYKEWNELETDGHWIGEQCDGRLSNLLLKMTNGVPLALFAVLLYFTKQEKISLNAFTKHIGSFEESVSNAVKQLPQLQDRLRVKFEATFFSCVGILLFCLMGSPQMHTFREHDIMPWLKAYVNQYQGDLMAKNFHQACVEKHIEAISVEKAIDMIPAYVTDQNRSLSLHIPPISSVEVSPFFQTEEFSTSLEFLSRYRVSMESGGDASASLFEKMVQSFFSCALISSKNLLHIFSQIPRTAIPSHMTSWMDGFNTPRKGFVLCQTASHAYQLSSFLCTTNAGELSQQEVNAIVKVSKNYASTCLSIFKNLRGKLSTDPFFLLCCPRPKSATADATILVSSGDKIVELSLQMKWRITPFTIANYWQEHQKSGLLDHNPDTGLFSANEDKDKALHIFLVVNPRLTHETNVIPLVVLKDSTEEETKKHQTRKKKTGRPTQQLCLFLSTNNQGIHHVFGNQIVAAFKYLQKLDPQKQNKDSSDDSQDLDTELRTRRASRERKLLYTYLSQTIPESVGSLRLISSTHSGKSSPLKRSYDSMNQSESEMTEEAISIKKQKTQF